MPVTVLIRSGASAESSSPSISFDTPLVVIGRGEGCDVRLPDPSVSHRHATIRQRGTEHIVVDEGSTNGTYIGGVRLGAQAPRILRNGELLRVGRVWLEIRFESALAPSNAPLATKELALALVARALDMQGEVGGPRIAVLAGPDEGKVLLLDEPARAYVIGRGKDADLALDDPNASRRHIQLVRRGDQLLARDVGSKNGAELGGAPLLENRDRVWNPGEELVIGDDRLGYAHPAAEALRELERAADEKIRWDEAVDPPVFPAGGDTGESRRESGSDGGSARATAAHASRARAAATTGDYDALDGANAAITTGPRAPPQRPVPTSGWTGADLLVVLLAVVVLGLSMLGLFWLLRG